MTLPSRILRKPDVVVKTGLPSRTIDRLEAAGQFPRRRRLTDRNVGWLEPEIDEWITSRPVSDD